MAWWRMDECQGNTIHDATGNGLHGTLNLGGSGQTSAGDCNTNANTAWYNGRDGKFNSSVNFDGTNDYVEVPDPGTSSALDFGLGETISISAWIYPTATMVEDEFHMIATKGWTTDTDDGNYALEFGRDGGNNIASFCFRGAAVRCYYTDTDVITLNTWQHLTATHTFGNAASTRIYHNGRLLTGAWQGGGGETPVQNNNALWLGASWWMGSAVTLFGGQIDDVRIYRYPLTPHQIRDIMNQGTVRFGP